MPNREIGSNGLVANSYLFAIKDENRLCSTTQPASLPTSATHHRYQYYELPQQNVAAIGRTLMLYNTPTKKTGHRLSAIGYRPKAP
jgi:hypothetical protein